MKTFVYKNDGTVYEIDAPEVIVPDEPIPEAPEGDSITDADMAAAILEGVNEV